MAWCLGITQHEHGVDTVRELVNVLLLRGNIGREGAGPCPIRGHSNVQGNRTCGVNHHLTRPSSIDSPRSAGSTRHASTASAPSRRSRLCTAAT
jgi:anaerobic selenocysteine-containing dehydrogenase